MRKIIPSSRALQRLMYLALAMLLAVSPSAVVFAQTNAAQQAVRRTVEGLGQPEQPEAPLDAAPPGSLTQPGRTAPTAGAIDTKYVAPSASAVVVIRPAQIMSSPMTEMLPREVATAAGLEYLGINPADVDEVVAFGDLSNMLMPSYGFTIKFNQPFKASAIKPERHAHTQLVKEGLAGKHYLQSQNPQHPMQPSFYGPNTKTLVVAPEETLRQMVEAGGEAPGNPFLDRVRQAPAGSDLYVAVNVTAMRPIAEGYLSTAALFVPADYQPLLGIPNLISAVELTFNLTGPGPTSLVVNANDEAAAQQILSLLNDASQKYQANLKTQLAEQLASDDPIQRALAEYTERVSGKSMAEYMPKLEGTRLTLSADYFDESQKNMLVRGLGFAAARLLPATMGAREAARSAQSTNNMKQIILAWHNYHSTHNAFPAHANYSDDGKPLLSWRVHILPFIDGGQQLYEQFKQDEPWDSEHNKALIAQMPAVYQHPNLKLEPGKTNYLALVGNECILNGTKEGVGMRNITDGTSKTIAFVEADPAQAVEWTKPDDLEFNPGDPKAGLGNVQPGGYNVALCDGSWRFIPETIDGLTLQALFTRAGGEPVEVPDPVNLPRAAGAPNGFQAVPQLC